MFLKAIFLASLALAVSGQTNYNTGNHGRSETVGPDGEVQGQYQYTGDDGKLITVKYRAGKDGFQVEGDHLPKPPQPFAPQQQQQQPQYYNPQQQYNPQQNYQQQQQQYNPQPQQPTYNNAQDEDYNHQRDYLQYQTPEYNEQPQQQQPQQQNYYQPQPQQQQQSLFQNFGQQQFGHPNALPGQYQQPAPQYYNNQGQNGQNRPTKVSVSQTPGQGFNYNFES